MSELGWMLFAVTYAAGAQLMYICGPKYTQPPLWVTVFWLPLLVLLFVSAFIQVSIAQARAAHGRWLQIRR